jgi:hypothetical protein
MDGSNPYESLITHFTYWVKNPNATNSIDNHKKEDNTS